MPVRKYSLLFVFLCIGSGLLAQEDTSGAAEKIKKDTAVPEKTVVVKKPDKKPEIEKKTAPYRPAGSVEKPVDVKRTEKVKKKVVVPGNPVKIKDPGRKQVAEVKGVLPDGALLQVKDGNFKYSRIPEIILKEKEQNREEDFVHISAENLEDPEKQDAENKEKGFFGLEKNTADWVAKIGLALLLVIIFLLYRVRSRGSRSVHRSYPK